MDAKTLMTTGIGGAGILASRDLVLKVLGPSADYLGHRLKDVVQKGDENLCRIFGAAARKLGDSIEEPGAVPPRVLRHIWDEGPFVEDALQVEYFGGLLAASRSGDGSGDRSLPLVNILKQMSSEQVRLHYVVYRNTLAAIARAFGPSPGRPSMPRPTQFFFRRTVINFKGPELAASLGHTAESPFNMGHAVCGLERMGLLGSNSDTSLNDWEDQFATFEPSYFGTDLFLCAHGLRTTAPEAFMLGYVVLEDDPLLPLCPTARLGTISGPATQADVEKAVREATGRDAPRVRVPPSSALGRRDR